MWPTKKLNPIDSSVLTFIGYRQTSQIYIYIDNDDLFRFNVDSKAKVGLVRLGAIGERLGRCIYIFSVVISVWLFI